MYVYSNTFENLLVYKILFHRSFIGPSGINQSFRLRGYGSGFHSDKCLIKSGSNSVKNTASDDGMKSDLDFSLNIDS